MRNRVKRAREQREWTHVELAHKVGVTPWTICRIESEDSTPTLELALKLGRVLGIPVASLFVLERHPPGSGPSTNRE